VPARAACSASRSTAVPAPRATVPRCPPAARRARGEGCSVSFATETRGELVTRSRAAGGRVREAGSAAEVRGPARGGRVDVAVVDADLAARRARRRAARAHRPARAPDVRPWAAGGRLTLPLKPARPICRAARDRDGRGDRTEHPADTRLRWIPRWASGADADPARQRKLGQPDAGGPGPSGLGYTADVAGNGVEAVGRRRRQVTTTWC
jgi:hypothetical protein